MIFRPLKLRLQVEDFDERKPANRIAGAAFLRCDKMV